MTIDENLTQLNTSTQAGVIELANGTTPVIGDDSKFFSKGFVERDPAVFIGKDVSRVGNQIKHLRGRLMWLISAEANLICLTELREPLTINGYINDKPTDKNSLAVSSYNKNSLVVPELDKSNPIEEYLSELSYIEAQFCPNLELPELSNLLQWLSEIINEIELRIAKVNSSFDSAVFPALSRDEFVEAMVFKIKHQKLREEANMQLTLIREFVKMLDGNLLTREDFDVLSDKGKAAVSVMIAIEKRRKIVEELVRFDQKEREKTIRLVRRYVIGAVVIA
ncbi:MAG: hypothetical protein KME05_17525 [Gloeocapsa sp. UFS-A4-WI-NPMV-4B04]|nr:hypothetical protein [Gloeocapsa sp. UFS-A4-WI-NPMV-4B04]